MRGIALLKREQQVDAPRCPEQNDTNVPIRRNAEVAAHSNLEARRNPPKLPAADLSSKAHACVRAPGACRQKRLTEPNCRRNKGVREHKEVGRLRPERDRRDCCVAWAAAAVWCRDVGTLLYIKPPATTENKVLLDGATKRDCSAQKRP